VEPTDTTVEILREIRDEIRNTSTRVDKTNERLEQTNERLEQMGEDLGRRITQSEVRTATAIVALAASVDSVKDLLEDRLDLRDRVERCEVEIVAIKRRLDTDG
jgi:predicted  nucleic acid-binding Zn-ribbon protein